KNVNLVGVRVLSCTGSGSTSGVIAGVDWVAANASGPSVANMSLGGGQSVALDSAVQSAVQSGVSFMLAAGNSNADACNYSPARV
ncbi:S8 family serine peptidase, partial [Vibrio parahaemolyticus]